MKIVVISKDQPEFVDELVSTFDSDYIIVKDRCVLDYPVGYNYITNTTGTGFLAGYCRDLGAKEFDDDILFLDGDKIPDITEKQLSYVSTIGFECVLLGLGLNDFRKFMTCGEGRIPDYSICSINNEVYSCGIYLSKRAISEVKKLNNGRIFNSEFDGNWGEEDRYLGDQLSYLNIPIGYTSKITLSNKITDLSTTKDEIRKNEYKINHLKRLKLYRDLKHK